MQKVITIAPKDIYGEDAVYIIFEDDELRAMRVIDAFANFPSASFVPWSLLTDKERDTVWNELGNERYDGYVS